MAWDNERKAFNKTPFDYLELTADGTTYRFCSSDIAIMPKNITATPMLLSFAMSPATIDLQGGIGIRATASATIKEFNDYKVYGSINSPVRFWAAWRAHNRNYRYTTVSHYSGYLVNNNVESDNFIRRDYVIESMSYTGESVSFSLRDTLMLTNDSKAVCPRPSNGTLSADITDTATSFTLLPAGIADDEYPEAATGDSSTHYFIRLNNEVVLVTNRTAGSDTFSITRAQYGTTAVAHSQNDTAQLCYYNPSSPADFDYDVLVNYAGVDPSFIDKGVWDARSSAAFPNIYDPLITEPTGVRTLLKESCESAPHYLYYDTRFNKIQFKPQEAPPTSAGELTFSGNLLDTVMTVKDRYDLFITNVAVFFDIRDPTKDLDEQSNYRQIFEREDTSAIAANGGVKSYKFIYSRFINGSSKSAAVLASALIGRRFSAPPYELTYELDPKDGDVWTGDNISIESDLIFDSVTNAPTRMMFQVVSANENIKTQKLKYVAVQHTYGDAVPGDEDVEDPNTRLVYISGNQDQLKDPDTGVARSLRDYYDDTYPSEAIQAGFNVKFIIESNGVVGSSDTAQSAIRTGTWPELTTPPLIINTGLVAGCGANGGDSSDLNGRTGGAAILLENDIRLDNQGTIGGGGGGGGASQNGGARASGGGGAGYFNGIRGNGTYSSNAADTVTYGQNGTNTVGGAGARVDFSTFGSLVGGAGGDLGQNGAGGVDVSAGATNGTGGVAGKAIDLNGFTVTYITTGTILGTVS